MNKRNEVSENTVDQSAMKTTAGKKILVIVDMQTDFVNGVLGNEETKAVLPKVVEKLRDHYDEYDASYAASSKNAKRFRKNSKGIRGY